LLSAGSGTSTTELGTMYDRLIMYKAAVLYYQREEDQAMTKEYMILGQREENRLRTKLSQDSRFARVEMDPRFFIGNGNSIANPDILF
ncbi:unnamed protein product, partial [marine sediment metagenome]